MNTQSNKVLLKEKTPLGLVPSSVRRLINNEIRENRLSYDHVTVTYEVKDRERFPKVSRVLYPRDGEDIVNDVWRAITSFTFAKFFLLSVEKGTKLYRIAFNWRSSEHIRSWSVDTFLKIRSKGYDSVLTWKRYDGGENFFSISCLYATALFEEHLSNFIDREWLAVNMICRRESGSKFSQDKSAAFFPKHYESDKIRLWKDAPKGELCYYDSDGKVTFQPFSYSFESGRAMGSLVQFSGSYLRDCFNKDLLGEPKWFRDDYAAFLLKRARLGRGGNYVVNSFHNFVAQRILADLFSPAITTSKITASQSSELRFISGVTKIFSTDTVVRVRQAVMYKFLSTAAGIKRCSGAYVAPTFQAGRKSILDLTTRNIVDAVFYSGNTALMTGNYPIRWAKMASGYSTDELRHKYPDWLIIGSGKKYLIYRPPADKDLPTYNLDQLSEESLRLERRHANRVAQVGKEIRSVFKAFTAEEFSTLFFRQGDISLVNEEARSSEAKVAHTKASREPNDASSSPLPQRPSKSLQTIKLDENPPVVVQTGDQVRTKGTGRGAQSAHTYSKTAAGTIYRVRSGEF